jgi:hypothetical protein
MTAPPQLVTIGELPPVQAAERHGSFAWRHVFGEPAAGETHPTADALTQNLFVKLGPDLDRLLCG